MAAYERNTGEPHPLSGGIRTLGTGKRDAGPGGVTLTDFDEELWFGTISVGTPPRIFTGVTFVFSCSVFAL